MSDLYTSQVHLKRLLAGQATAAFTPAPEAVLKMLDPAFFPGMGALNEDEYGRLQCPVRGCGIFMAHLSRHLNGAHRGIGGASAIRVALDIRNNRPLLSAKLRVDARRIYSGGSTALARRYGGNMVAAMTSVSHSVERHGNPRGRVSLAQRNEADTCPGQFQARLMDLAREIGRSPSRADFERRFGVNASRMIQVVFGTWNNAKALAGLSCVTPEAARRRACRGITSILGGIAWRPACGESGATRRTDAHDSAL